MYSSTDINECANPNACGINTNCFNTPGNYSCECQDGFEGNAFDGVCIATTNKFQKNSIAKNVNL